METKYLLAGDKAIVVEFGDIIDEDINRKVINLMKNIESSSLINSIYEMIPTYRSLMIIYNPLKITFNDLINSVKNIECNLKVLDKREKNIIKIPVLYGNDYGPDIDTVAKHNRLSIEEVIRLHSEAEYLVYMLGFTPGFTYLGGMNNKLETPRLDNPRVKIPEGSVGIAGKQTGVYPIESPGGWQLIGRTPIKLYNPKRENPILLKAGDYVKFTPITKDEFNIFLNEGGVN
ncbi:5-oxoprolinase subunit PxpB [Paraclostridium bifermentans]|uniref:5-oxoprolinase subunit PxpB n=1 Tax=Paraclostridium bifermentans TaxID=1490 RepID=A0A5P3XIM6_PARBF|nr:5-oxoprolinase subunit PxpB [Paraclostridium bifermentans]MDV8108864.1 5-oxoprolinase subunit PxpB [Bacillus sp. BAU-SS-2023]MCR1875480.1 5-oxoprolinase subunit PxpB [Paraclostridium bifermentans]QEZ70197.1 5-oxoprolinase subunit PxpB [Paraclostridium bifermentans]TQO58871.1 5-oxoprolinase subunit PxpB [Paraclostridium bifermentans]UOW67155.1 5-oxoprolinase subunit PxpB [Paraclostridium bifermentans]